MASSKVKGFMAELVNHCVSISQNCDPLRLGEVALTFTAYLPAENSYPSRRDD